MDKKESFNRANAMAGKPTKFRNAAAVAAKEVDLLGLLKSAGMKDGLVGE